MFAIRFLLFLSALLSAESANDFGQECKKFSEIYDDGTDLCTTMWGDAFIVNDTLPDVNQYTMGWVDGYTNPNDAASAANGYSIATVNGEEKCGLHYYHYNYTVQQKPGEYGLCQNYKNNACCMNTTVQSFEHLSASYGDQFHVDRCGPLSESCKQFFIMEACLYECDPNAGLFRRYSDAQVAADVAKYGHENLTNRWEMYHMPVRKSFCNQWYDACYNDMFCGAADGNFFSCAKIYEAALTPEQIQLANEQKMNAGLIAMTVILTIFGCCLICGLIYLVHRERTGKAVFAPLMEGEKSDGHPMQSMHVNNPGAAYTA